MPVGPLALAFLLIAPAHAGTAGRVVEPITLGETPGLGTAGASPAVNLQLNPAAVLSGPTLSAALNPAALTPTLIAASAVLQKPQAVKAAALIPTLAAPATPDKPIDALRRTGASLASAKPGAGADVQALDALFVGDASKNSAAAVEPGPNSSPAQALKPATKKGRTMPKGVKKVFQNGAVLGGGMAALSAAMYAWTQTFPSAPGPLAFSLLAFPLLLIPVHFAAVMSSWAGRFFAYPKLSDAGKKAFRAAWKAFAAAYPVSALAALTVWAQTLGGNLAMLLAFGPAFAVAAAEVVHHFVWRLVPEGPQDKGKPLTDVETRWRGTVGRQLGRMK